MIEVATATVALSASGTLGSMLRLHAPVAGAPLPGRIETSQSQQNSTAPGRYHLQYSATKSMTTKGACAACRAGKVKCISSATQRCERCTTRGIRNCTYEPVRKRGVGKDPPAGKACKRCRSQKKRCDAKLPCARCVKANTASECEYEIADATPDLLNEPRFIFWNAPDPSTSSGLSPPQLQEKGAVPGLLIKPQPTPVAPRQQALGSVPTPLALVRPLGHNNSLTCGSPDSSPGAPKKIERHSLPFVTLPPFSTLLSPKISPVPLATSSFPSSERFQISDVTPGELEMKFRLSVLCRMSKLGLKFTSEKQRALFNGDTSGSFIHPFFIPATQALGMHFCEGMADSPVMVLLHTKYIQMCLGWLLDIFKGHDWELRAHVALWIATASATLPIDHLVVPYLQRSCEAINAAGLQFVPTYGQPPVFSEPLHEKLSVLSQVIYFENFLFLACSGAEPTMTARIEKEFRYQLPEVYPVLFKICPLTMRTKAILLVRDAVLILTHRPCDETQLGIWRQSCDQLAALLDDYSQTLLSNLQRFQELGDKSGAETIRSCCVNCFAHLAVLCEALGGIGPTPQIGMDTLCDSSLVRLGRLAEDMRVEEYTRHDLLLGISWERALGVFNTRLAKVSVEHGTKLRHWRHVIAELRLDFAAKVPDGRIPSLAKKTEWVYAHAKGSRYPNLVDWEK